MKAIILIIGLIIGACLTWLVCAPSRLGSWWLAKQIGARPAEYSVRIERGVTMTSYDGTLLVADVYQPSDASPHPTILVRIPYTKNFYNTMIATVVGRYWAERGYHVVIQGTRGRYESDGTYDPFKHERRDGIETLRWIAKQPWFNGRLGMWGGSYFGYTQWVLADQSAPGASAFNIQIASSEFYRMFYPGGALSLESALNWAVSSHGKEDIEPDQETLDRGFNGLPLIQADDRAITDIPFFNDWVNHPTRDEYWHAVDGDERVKNLTAPALLMAGWYDPFLPAQLDDFVRIRRDTRPEVAAASRLVVGPWAHARTVILPDGAVQPNYRVESFTPSVPWFDQHLRGTGEALAAPVRIFVMGANVWRDEQEWPLERTQFADFFLDSSGRANSAGGDGRLSLKAPAENTPSDTFIYDPLRPVPSAGGAMIGPRAGIALQNKLEARPDVLVYSTPPLDKDIEATGPVKLILFVATTAPNTDFTAKLVDIFPDGSAYNVSDGILRRGYEGNSPTKITVDLWPTSFVFRKGHRIRLEVSSSNFPRFDRNPNTGRTIATETETIVARQMIHHSSSMPSRLVLPVIPHRETATETRTTLIESANLP